jgi:hypothetical protein
MLFAEIAELQSGDPLRAVTIVVASNLLGVHLRRRYVEWRESCGLTPAHGGISFSSLAGFAEEVAGPGAPPLPAFGDFALISSALARLPEARVFGDLAGRPDLVPSIAATIRDLSDAACCWGRWLASSKPSSGKRRDMRRPRSRSAGPPRRGSVRRLSFSTVSTTRRASRETSSRRRLGSGRSPRSSRVRPADSAISPTLSFDGSRRSSA